MRLLDRYIFKSLLLPLLYCFLGIVSIWLIQDMGDKLPALIDAGANVSQLLRFYRIQIPQIIVFSLPIALLLAALYSLGKLSRSNEIVSMVAAGVSISRLLVPLYIVGLLATGATLALNYRLAPESALQSTKYYKELNDKRKRSKDLTAVLFRNREANRTWYVERLAPDGSDARGVQILQQTDGGDAVWKLFARSAKYNPQTKIWTFLKGEFLELEPNGKIVRQKPFETREFADLDESMIRIITIDVLAENLGVPALHDYLQMNRDLPEAQLGAFKTHLHYRWALPWACLIVLLLAGGLGIAFSRRGVMRGVLTAIVLFFLLFFLRALFISLGQGGRIAPIPAAWVPMVLFGLLGIVLIWLRSSGSNRSWLRFGSKN